MTDTSQHMDRAMHTAGPAARTRGEREFRRARRHSRLVAVLRFGLPLIGVLIVAGGVFATWFARSLPEEVAVSGATLDDGRIVMQDPRMSGFDSRDRPYSMIATRAIQSLGGNGIDLEEVRASLPVSTDATAEISARAGHYDAQGSKLRLDEAIRVETSDGTTLSLAAADIDIDKGALVGKGPVDIVSPTQTIRAGSMTVADNGQRVTFADRVRVTFTPGEDTPLRPTPPAPPGARASQQQHPSPSSGDAPNGPSESN